MPLSRLVVQLQNETEALEKAGTAKGAESVVVRVERPQGAKGPRFYLAGEGDKPFVRMNSNSYLGLGLDEGLIKAEEEAVRAFGVGPGAVRFISGTYQPHVALEARLAAFHGREACMLTSAAYTSVLGVISSLTTDKTLIISDELNHNCIINAMKLARPLGKEVYRHLDLAGLEAHLVAGIGKAEQVIVVTDGVFSMRGDLAPLKEMAAIITRYSDRYPRDVVFMVDDSHGVGALGATGRGTEEVEGVKVDILVGTLGKAFGVNGGYVVSDRRLINYLRQKNSFYIYTNPITVGEAAAALCAVDAVDTRAGKERLTHLHALTARFEKGLVGLGFETISSPHPVVPLFVRDTQKTRALVRHLREHGVLATGLGFPVVPKGEELIRFQVSAEHTAEDIDFVLAVLEQAAR